jgi:tetratricopeptide (TPR) repeat protein
VRDADAAIAELERAWRANPDGEAFAGLAELYRRAGRLAEAANVVRQGLVRSPRSLEGRAVLLLVLADAGQSGEARRLLESWATTALEGVAPDAPEAGDALAAAGVSELELERAFEAAEPERDRMITPDSVAEEAALFADGPEALRSPLESGATFATRTMAELLERQGDRQGAARIRAALAESELPEAPPARSEQTQVIAVLERWLENARRLQP